VICPKCGRRNAEGAHECEHCGIIFIRWMIQQYRALDEPPPPPPGKMAPAPPVAVAFSFPRAFTRTTLLGCTSAALLVGLLAGRLLPRHAPQPWESTAPVRVGEAELREHAAPVLRDASEGGRSRGIAMTPAALLPYFEQGANDFTLENLKAAAAAAGKGVPTMTAEEDDGHAHRDTPYRCLREGAWTYSPAPPGIRDGAQECWAMNREPRRDGALRWSAVFWEKLTWVPEKGRWALFSSADERAWFRSHIESRLGAEAEQADLAESEKLLKEAGSDPEKRLTAAAAAYRTRLRRAGALYRLRRLGSS